LTAINSGAGGFYRPAFLLTLCRQTLRIVIMNITHKEKDKVLDLLCSGSFYAEEMSCPSRVQFMEMTGLDSRDLNSVLTYFARAGIISDLNYRHSSPLFSLIIYQDAFDIFNRGGFAAQEYMLQKEVEKLLLEIERLKPSLGDKIEQVSTIANNIAGIAGSFLRGMI
jgi:hypothetical protein